MKKYQRISLIVLVARIAMYFVLREDRYARVTQFAHPASKEQIQKPIAVLHIGPPKTSSSSIQKFLYDNQELLLSDNFVVAQGFPGLFDKHKSSANIAICVNEINFTLPNDTIRSTSTCEKTMKAFDEFAAKAVQSKRNIIISSEMFTVDHPNTTRLVPHLAEFDVHVVVVYRRLYELLSSSHNERMKVVPYAKRWGVVDYYSRESNLDKRANYYAFNTFKMYLDSQLHPTGDVVNFHDTTKPPLEAFLCDHVRGATPNTCAYIQNNTGAVEKRNARASLHPSLVIKAAIETGYDWSMLSATQRQMVQKRLGAYIQRREAVLPKICINETMRERILQMSVERENQFVPSWHDPPALRKDFLNQQSTQFCQIDAETFLKQLRKETRQKLFPSNPA